MTIQAPKENAVPSKKKVIYDHTYKSVADLAKTAEGKTFASVIGSGGDPDWVGAKDADEVRSLAKEGWAEQLPEVLTIAEDAVATVEQTNEVPAWNPVWDVSGGSVDMGAYVTGEPECMITVPPVRVAKVGRVVTICVSRSVSGSVSAKNIISQGQVIVGLALALERLGYGLEIITDVTVAESWGGNDNDLARTRVVVKGAREVIDPEMLMYALAHPSYLRFLTFCAEMAAPEDIRNKFDFRPNGGFGMPHDPVQDLPEGTLYTKAFRTGHDKDIAAEIEQYLRDLDILV